MKRLQIIAVLALLAALPACSAADEPADRSPVDAGRDTKTTPRADAQSADQLDASGGSYADETSSPPDPDVIEPDTTSPPVDVAFPPPDVADARSDPPAPDGTVPPPSDAPPLPPADAPPDQAVTSCLVTFTVSGVTWAPPEGGTLDGQATSRVVRLVGDAPNLGSWGPTAGLILTETAPGTWSGTATFRDQQLTEFKFVKLEGATPEWESWQPYDSNRSLRVECFDDGGVVRDAADATVRDGGWDGTSVDASGDTFDGGGPPSDAATDGVSPDGAFDGPGDAIATDAVGDSSDAGAPQDGGPPSDGRVIPVPARGRSYAGVFGVRPPDATK